MSHLDALLQIVARLRGPDGCPWDRAQDLATMRPYLLEEAYEALEALDGLAEGQASPEAVGKLREELGDLLFVVALIAQISADRGWFTLDEAAGDIADKMVRRHPHVFGSAEERARDGVESSGIAAWEARKVTVEADGRPRSRLAGVPRSLPGLLRAHRQGEKAASVGFDWPDHGAVLAKVHEELGELEQALQAHPPVPRGEVDATTRPAAHPAVEHELGDVLMALADLGRHLRAPAESALRRGNDRFRRRFERVEALAHDRGLDLRALDAVALDALWEQAKRDLSSGAGD